jgi:hypothetical protein
MSTSDSSHSIKTNYLSHLDLLQKQLTVTSLKDANNSNSLSGNTSILPNNNSENMNFHYQNINKINRQKEDLTIYNSSFVIPPPGFALPSDTQLRQQSSAASSHFSPAQSSYPQNAIKESNVEAIHNKKESNIFSKNLHNTLKSILPNANISFGYNDNAMMSNVNLNNTNVNNSCSISTNINNSSTVKNSNNDIFWPDDPAIISSFTDNSFYNGINSHYPSFKDNLSYPFNNQLDNDLYQERKINDNQLNNYIQNYNQGNNIRLNDSDVKSEQNNLNYLGNIENSCNQLSSANNLKLYNENLQHNESNTTEQALIQQLQALKNIYGHQSKFIFI